jgi:hypothetical protein
VADAVRSVDWTYAESVFEVAQFARSTAYREMIVAVKDRDSRRVVSAVFQPAQAIENDGYCSPVPDVSDNATHM